MGSKITRKDFLNGVALTAAGALLRPLEGLAQDSGPDPTAREYLLSKGIQQSDAGGFDPDRDLEAITVNRWPHGYADYFGDLEDPDRAPGQRPNVVGRQRFGRIAIANSDAAASAQTQAAIDEAYRAVQELTQT